MSHEKKKRRKFETDTRHGITTKGRVGSYKFYVTTNFYDETSIPGEVFIIIAKEGSTLGGMMEHFAITLSVALQYGVPWKVLSEFYKHSRFEPMDQHSSSLIDRIANIIDEQVQARESVWGDNNEPPREVRCDKGGDTAADSEHNNESGSEQSDSDTA